MKYSLFFLIFVFQAYPQINPELIELLGKVTVLSNLHEEFDSEICGVGVGKSQFQRFEDIVKNGSYKYSYKLIDSISDIQIMRVYDETNFRLHGLYNVFWATRSYHGTVYEILKVKTIDNIVEIIDNFLLSDTKDSVDKFKIIQFYNALYANMNTYYGREVTFYSDTNKSRFAILEKTYRPDNFVVTPELINKRYMYSNLYIDVNGETTSFYLTQYSFECNKFKVSHHLLYKLPYSE